MPTVEFVWHIEEHAPKVSKPKTQRNVIHEKPTLAISAEFVTEYKATGLPEGLSINSLTGDITGEVEKVQETLVVVTVSGPAGTATTEFAWVVEELCIKPTDVGAPWRLFEEEPPIKPEPGDAVISTSSGKVWKNVNGVLSPLVSASKFALIEKYVKQAGPFFYNTSYLPSKEFVTLAVISSGEENPAHVFIGAEEVAEIEFHGSVVPMTFIIPVKTSWEIRAAKSSKLKSVAYAFFPE